MEFIGTGSGGADSGGDDNVVADSGGYDSVGADSVRGGIGAGSDKKNRRAQLKEQAALKKAEASSSKTPKEPEPTFQQLLGIVLRKDWSSEDGLIICEVMDQEERDICWAIVITRLVQAIHNIRSGNTQLHLELLIDELVECIKSKDTNKLELHNMNLAFKHVANRGILKKSVGNKHQSAGARGNRITMAFEKVPDVEAAFIQEKLDRYPVGLILETERFFNDYQGNREKIYHLPKKNNPHIEPFHCVLLIGYGVTEKNETYFIAQNSYGDTWGCKGYIQMIIPHKCDIICVKE